MATSGLNLVVGVVSGSVKTAGDVASRQALHDWGRGECLVTGSKSVAKVPQKVLPQTLMERPENRSASERSMEQLNIQPSDQQNPS